MGSLESMLALALAPLPPTLVVDGFVVGARVAGKWSPVDVKTGWAKRSTATFREIRVGALGRTMKAGFADEEVPVGVYLSGGMIDIGGVLVGGATPRVPRRAVDLPASSNVYVGVLRRFLDGRGLKAAKARVVRVVQVDLDGDGTNEVLIEARNRDDLTSRGLTINFGPNDYSVVLLRALRNGKVVETPLGLALGRKNSDGLHRTLRAIADLDGDGRMEIVTSYKAWEAFGGGLWSYRAGRATRLIETGSGV